MENKNKKIVAVLDQSGNYLGNQKCQVCPITKGWIYPTYYSETLPDIDISNLQKSDKIVFSNNEYKIINTKMNIDIWNKETKQHKLNEQEENIPEGWTENKPLENKPCKWDETKNDWKVDIEKYKKQKYNELNSGFSIELSNGKFYSETLQAEVDCRRGGHNNDKQNVEGLVSYMERNNIANINYVAYDSIVPDITVNQLKSLIIEMEDHVLVLYNKRWTLRDQLENSTTEKQIDDIQWNES